MQPGIEDKFIEFISRGDVEGELNKMYLDTLGKVTTAIGYLIDSPEAALELQWLRDGSNNLASRQEVIDVWNAVKARQDLAPLGGVASTQIPENNIHLSQSEINRVTRERLDSFIRTLRAQFPSIDIWPADAQFQILHMSWAKGPGFQGFPRFSAFLNQLIPDFAGAATESHVGGLSEKRNAIIRQGFENAANVLRMGADPSVLYWPNEVVAKAGIGLLGFGLLAGAGYFAYHYAKQKGLL